MKSGWTPKKALPPDALPPTESGVLPMQVDGKPLLTVNVGGYVEYAEPGVTVNGMHPEQWAMLSRIEAKLDRLLEILDPDA